MQSRCPLCVVCRPARARFSCDARYFCKRAPTSVAARAHDTVCGKRRAATRRVRVPPPWFLYDTRVSRARRRFLANRGAVVGAVLVALLVALAIAGPHLG